MSPEQIFSLCGMLVLPGWLLLVSVPRWKWAARLVCPVVIPLLRALAYLWLVATTRASEFFVGECTAGELRCVQVDSDEQLRRDMEEFGQRLRLCLADAALAVYDFRGDPLRLEYVQQVALFEFPRRH